MCVCICDDRYGCCLDGITPAQGFKRQGCPDLISRVHLLFFFFIFTVTILLCSVHHHTISLIVWRISPTPDPVLVFLCFQDHPVRMESASDCGLEKDAGSCYDWTSRFYFDRSSGSCSQFWYGGCHGNGNNFVSKEECERRCKGAAGLLAPRKPTFRKGIKRVTVYRLRSRAHA